MFNFLQQERKGKGGHTLSAGEASNEEGGAAPLPSPLGKKAAERERDFRGGLLR